jgi:hypothetical protein
MTLTSYRDQMDSSSLGTSLARSLEAGERTGDLLRLVRQFIMDTDRRDQKGVTENIATTPRLTGDRGWDALIAGVVEDIAYRHGVAVPSWAMEPARSTADRWWFVTSIPALHPTAFVETPASLGNRGVFIRRASLVNV